MILAIDVDGVVADFNKPFGELLMMLDPTLKLPLDDPTWPECWSWPKAHGVLKEVEDRAWAYIDQPACEFWYNLPSYEGADAVIQHLSDLDPTHQVYWVTSRHNQASKMWTEVWLAERGFENPTVISTRHPSQKAPIVAALEADAFIDDKLETCLEVEAMCPAARVFLADRPWTTQREVYTCVERIRGLGEMLDELKLGVG